MSGIFLQKYTEKSIVVRGDTRPRKDEIKAIGGKFGYFGNVPGWMFPATQEQVVREALRINSPLSTDPGINHVTKQAYTQSSSSVSSSNTSLFVNPSQVPISKPTRGLRGPPPNENEEEPNPEDQEVRLTLKQLKYLVNRVEKLEAEVFKSKEEVVKEEPEKKE